MTDYVAIDLEMTGLTPRLDRIIEIGAIKHKAGSIETFQTLVDPEMPLTEEVTEITGITNDMLEGATDIDSAMTSFMEFVGDLPLVAHCVSMDYAFLKQWALNHKVDMAYQGVDTLYLSRRLCPDTEKHTLLAMQEYFGIKNDKQHRALGDAVACDELYQKLLEKFGDQDPSIFEPRPLHYSGKKQTPATQRQLKYLKELLAYHNLTPESQDIVFEKLTRSEASRKTDQLLSTYGRMNEK